jgi:hypothetical protein
MCPFCISTIGLLVAGAVSSGGLATLALKVSRKKGSSTETIPTSNKRSNHDVD